MTDVAFLAIVTGGIIGIGLANPRESISFCFFEGYPLIIGLKL